MRTYSDNKLLKEFGQRVRTLRESSNLSQEHLAELTGLDRTYISSIERGNRNIGLLNCARIANALNVDMTELFIFDPPN